MALVDFSFIIVKKILDGKNLEIMLLSILCFFKNIVESEKNENKSTNYEINWNKLIQFYFCGGCWKINNYFIGVFGM